MVIYRSADGTTARVPSSVCGQRFRRFVLFGYRPISRDLLIRAPTDGIDRSSLHGYIVDRRVNKQLTCLFGDLIQAMRRSCQSRSRHCSHEILHYSRVTSPPGRKRASNRTLTVHNSSKFPRVKFASRVSRLKEPRSTEKYFGFTRPRWEFANQLRGSRGSAE